MRRLIALAALLALAAGTAHARPPARPQVWNQSYTVAPRPTVRIITDDGRVVVHARPGATVEAHVTYDGRHQGLVFGSSRPRVEFEHAGNTVVVTAKTPSTSVVFGWSSERLRVEVTVPTECDVEVRSGDGSIEVEPFTGRLVADVGDGHVRVKGVRGQMMLSTSDGAIEIENADGDLLAHTGDGRITASGRFDGLDLRTGDGRVAVEALAGSKLGSEWSLESNDGPLSLSVAPDLKATLDVRAGDGPIHVDLPVTIAGRFREHEVHGTLNGGGPLLRIRTGDGSVTLSGGK